MAGDCRLEARDNKQGQGDTRPLINDIAPKAVTRAEQGSESQILSQFMTGWIGRNPLPNDPPDRAWTNLRSIQALMAADGFAFREGFPTTGPVSAELMNRVLTGATKGNHRIVEIRDGSRREGDIVASAAPQNNIGRETCGLQASLGVVMADGRVAKYNGSKASIVAATEFFKQADVRTFRVVP